MSSQRTTFGKRQREQAKQEKLKAKQARLANRRANTDSTQKGPPMGEPQVIEQVSLESLSAAGGVAMAPAPTPDPTPPKPGSLLPPIVSRRS